MPLLQQLAVIFFFFAALADVVIALITSAHVVLSKRDTRAAIAWVGLIWFAPIAGSLLYLMFGINRIERKARKLRRNYTGKRRQDRGETSRVGKLSEAIFDARHEHLRSLVKLSDQVNRTPLQAGNRIDILVDGDHAYPEMLAAIEQATESVALSTYIFDNDQAGQKFLAALSAAVQRKVEVRVLIDDMGARYSWPSIPSQLRSHGIPCATFMHPWLPWRWQHTNLRTHRKIMVVDGCIGFTGGMNIREGHWKSLEPSDPITDMHYRVEGPVVRQLQEVFAEDWAFCTGEELDGLAWFPELQESGEIHSRGLADGPDESLESFHLTILGAIASARFSIQIVTPYFLPDNALITALNVAALRGVEVDIVLPAKNNIRLVQWAASGILWQLLERGCRIYWSPPPFDHTKLVVIDQMACFVGSSNWDARSFRLNFEFNLEFYDHELGVELHRKIEEKKRVSRPVTLEELKSRSIPIRLRDGIAALFSPYL